MDKMDKFEELLFNLRTVWPQGQWDWKHRDYQVRKFVDKNDGIWDLGGSDVKCPCGCSAVPGQNQQRAWHYCDKHPERGVLVLTFAENKIYWLAKP
jgi:hypothetical protein